jgi:hypothetical protein
MPFDGNIVNSNSLALIGIDQMIDYFSDEKHWCKKRGMIAHEDHDKQYCLLGMAITTCHSTGIAHRAPTIFRALGDVIEIKYPEFKSHGDGRSRVQSRARISLTESDPEWKRF